MEQEFYSMIFRRKSFHHFRNVGDDRLTPDELDGIGKAFEEFDRLDPEIRTAIRIVPAETVNCARGAAFCILIYSEKKENFLLNAGDLGEQLDLWLVQHRIGSLWYGFGKPDEAAYCGMDFVIMMAIRKVSDSSKFRKELFRAKRRPLDECWSGDGLGTAEIARFAPSACNSQPWYVENRDDELTVYRRKKPGKVGLMSPAAACYFNRIDMGIYLCILELCLEKNGIAYTRTLSTDDGGDRELTKTAVYRINRTL